jgi:protein-S-isoprenylcysteine O-methyltransferase Ste14
MDPQQQKDREVGQKDAAAVKVFPPGLALLTILIGVLLQRLRAISLGFELPTPQRYWAGGLIIAGAILGLGYSSVRLFRKTGQSVNPWKPTPEIVERGPFRITRNPMYLQLVLVCVGAAVMLMNVWILILTPICAWLLQKLAILPEEAYLERKFGDRYLMYKKRVRRWL